MATKKEVEKKEKKPPFYIKKCVTSIKGVLDIGAPVEFKFFKGGEDVVEKLVESGHVIDTEGYFKKKAEEEKKKGK